MLAILFSLPLILYTSAATFTALPAARFISAFLISNLHLA
jgi:hypothetical protein